MQLLILTIPIFIKTFINFSYGSEIKIGSYDSDNGVFIGKFINNNGVFGLVYAINDSAIQIVNFTWHGKSRDTFFWLDTNSRPTREGVRLITFEYGNSPIGTYGLDSPTRVVLLLPNESKILNFKSLSIFSLEDNIGYAILNISDLIKPPKPQILPDEIEGSRYKISGVVQIVDTKTLRIIGFSFEGNKAPDGYFFVGQGSNITSKTGTKALIRGRDQPNMILPMNEHYTGNKDVYVELINGYDIQRIDYFAVYSVRFDVVYASISLKNISRYNIPPHINHIKSYKEMIQAASKDAWNLSNLLGTSKQKNFTFQLGPSGERRGYQTMHQIGKAPRFVWYVNGYLANLYLKRGETYTFIVEGGRNSSVGEFTNPLYLSNSSYGGYSKLTTAERQYEKIYAPEDPESMSSGRLCQWIFPTKKSNHLFNKSTDNNDDDNEFDEYLSFIDFREKLKLICDENDVAAKFNFTPTATTPDILYFGSYHNYQMGSKIFVVNEFPVNLKHIVEEPYQYEAWRHQDNLELEHENESVSRSTVSQIFNHLIMSLLLISIAVLIC